jgi:hypothetical protein
VQRIGSDAQASVRVIPRAAFEKVLFACWLQAARHRYSRKSGPDRDVHEVVFKHQSISANLQAALSE